METIFNSLGTAKIFSKVDLRSGFVQAGIKLEDQPKTVFWMGKELWMYTKLNFGLKNGPPYFQRMMEKEMEKGRTDAVLRSLH